MEIEGQMIEVYKKLKQVIMRTIDSCIKHFPNWELGFVIYIYIYKSIEYFKCSGNSLI